ncbi:MAG: ComEC family competence protein [Sphingobacteriaceae bacterium]|nr:ComEC family competence protein [Sphingobacteriaceae bacterium]
MGTMLLFIKRTGNQVNHSLLFVLDLFLFFFALNLTQNSRSIDPCTHYSNYSNIDTVFWVGQVDDIPVNKPRSLKLNLSVLKIKNDTGYSNCQGNVIAYVQNSQVANNIKPGNFILLKSIFQEVGKPQNPHAFDFKKYLAIHSVYHTCYVDSNSFSVLPNQISRSLWQMGLAIKYKIIKRLGEVDLSENARTICSALITGFDDDIDKKVLESFSHSGTLHILSVSGLHVGLIYLVLNYFLTFLDRNKKYKLLQLIFISLCLWLFALITGFSAPVLRSVIMFNLLGFGNLYFRNKAANQINILAVSAFILLLFNPLLVQDIGFLLSYCALFGILYFSPKFTNGMSLKIRS